MNERRGVYIGLGALGAALVFGLGFMAGHVAPSAVDIHDVAAMQDASTSMQADFAPFWKAWSIINEKYAGSATGTTPQDKVWGAIEGLTRSLGDPYSVFLPPQDAKDFQDMVAGSFGGVGLEIGERKGQIVVIAPLKGSPAQRAGIRAGDAVLKIGDTIAADLSVDEAVSLIRGAPGTVVSLMLARQGEEKPIELSVTRDTIDIPTIDTKTEGDVFVISLYNFDAKSTTEFKSAMREFAASGRRKLVLDLRGNPGGFLEAAVDIASYFLPAGDVVVRERPGEDGPPAGGEKLYRSKGYPSSAQGFGGHSGGTMIVLVDGGSASAAEILAGALSEQGAAKLLGEKTFGKGSVQELIPVTPDTELKLTVAQWFTPHGVSISKNGLTPDVEVKITPEDAAAGRDPQLAKALELL